MQTSNLQDGNVGNLGDVLKHAALVQLAKFFAENIATEKYYLDSHSYLYQSRLAADDWQKIVQGLLEDSSLYQNYIDIEAPFIETGNYLCSSGLVNKLIPDAHLLLCETNRETREWLLQQLADNKVSYHTVKAQMEKWVKGKKFKKLPNLLALIDPFEMTDELWLSVNKCLRSMLVESSPVILLVFDYKEVRSRDWPETSDNWLSSVACISRQPYHLAVYASPEFVEPVGSILKELGWKISPLD